MLLLLLQNFGALGRSMKELWKVMAAPLTVEEKELICNMFLQCVQGVVVYMHAYALSMEMGVHACYHAPFH